MKTKLFVLLLFIGKSVLSQVFIEHAPIGAAAAGEYNFYGTQTLNKSLPYNRIKGSPFWSDDWQLATFYSGKRRFSTLPVKLNLATQEVHFMLNEKELVATPQNEINAVIFHRNNDTSLVAAAFYKKTPQAYLRDEPFSAYMQVLSFGKYQLLKFTDRSVGMADTLFGTQKRYFFRDNITYYIRINEAIKPIKRLNEENVLMLLPSSAQYKEWIKQQKLNFKREEDLLKFITHYNAKLPDSPR
jgi:hypothetical protein